MSEVAASLSPRAPTRRMVPVRLLTDEALGRAAANGDGRAFTEIYSRYHQGLYRYCRSILASDADAQDALQNVMASALKSLTGETRDIALKPWLYRVAHNESISLVRRRRGHADLDAADDVPGEAAPAPEIRERLRQLFGDLAQLPERQRSALVMRELSGLDCTEIAAACGISTAAAAQAIYDARRGLQALAEGRDMQCEDVRRLASDNDRRTLRSRRMKAHMSACAGCRDFQSALTERPRDLAALAPALPASAGGALLHGLLGGGGSSGGSVGGVSGGFVASAKTAGGSLLLKGAVLTAVVGAGAGGVVAEREHSAAVHSSPAPVAAAPRGGVAAATPAAASASTAGRTAHGPAPRTAGSTRAPAVAAPAGGTGAHGGPARHDASPSNGGATQVLDGAAGQGQGASEPSGSGSNPSDHSHGNSSAGSSHGNSSSRGQGGRSNGTTRPTPGSHPTGNSSASHTTSATPAIPATPGVPGTPAAPATHAIPATPSGASHPSAGSIAAAEPGARSNAPAVPPSRSGR